MVESHRSSNARVFGSVLHSQDTDNSNLDILIDPTPETTLFDIGAIRHELGKLLGVRVDMLTPGVLPKNFRAKVLAEARPVRTVNRSVLATFSRTLQWPSSASTATAGTWTKFYSRKTS